MAPLSWLFAIVSASVVCAVATREPQTCERLSLKTPLTYTQEKAPRDLSGVLAVVVDKVNRVLDGVVDVEVEWDGGDLHGRVGEHVVRCKVIRLASAVGEDHRKDAKLSTDVHGREVVMQCFHIPFSITDTNECSLPSGHSMRHHCHAPAVCVNTIGSYECLCPRLDGSRAPGEVRGDSFWKQVAAEARSPWEMSFGVSSRSTCPSSASTQGCCASFPHSVPGRTCREGFRCPTDVCREGHDCSHNARCERSIGPLDRPNFQCKCPEGLMGNGHACRAGIDPKPEPKVKFDGMTPTEETIKNNYYCGCTKPVIDACEGFPPCTGKNEICAVTANSEPKCVCKPGYVDDGDGYGCVDETPPVLRLRDDAKKDRTLRLTQGDYYKEHAVDIIDDNAEEYARSLKIAYSKPLPPGCLYEMGEFHVNYTVATPWTSPPYVQITRNVVIENINECKLDTKKYESQCPELLPHCDFDAGATCIDTIGSYTCRCPEHTSGDGFLPIRSIESIQTPEGYKGGTGCVDTSKPIITVLGPNPKVLKVCKCGGLIGIMTGKSKDSDDLCSQQRNRYDSELKDMVRSTAGAELCATHEQPHPSPTDCAKAIDHTYKGTVDISKGITVGEPEQKSPLLWSVPYNVVDGAGNQAKTVWRDIVVEEVDVFGLESQIRAELISEKEAEVKRAVDQALSEEHRRHEQVEVKTVGSSRSRGGRMTSTTTSKTCPPCPKCECPPSGEFHPSMCNSICEKNVADNVGTCVTDEERHEALPYPLDYISTFIPPQFPVLLSWILVMFLVVIVVRSLATFFYNMGERESYQHMRPAQNEHDMQTHVRYFVTPHPNGMPRPGGAVGNGLFSPPQNRVYGQDRSQFWSPRPGSLDQNGDEDIYADYRPSPTGRSRRSL